MKRIALIFVIGIIYLLLLAGFSFSRAQNQPANTLPASDQEFTLETKTGWDPWPRPPFPMPPPPDPDSSRVAVGL